MKWANVLIVLPLMGMVQWANASPIVTNVIDSGIVEKSTYAPPPANSTDPVASPYGASLLTLTPIGSGSSITYKLSLSPSAGFLANANNLAGGKTVVLGGTLSFDIAFDAPVFLTANLSLGGVYSVSGAKSRVDVIAPGSGITITQLDDLSMPESRSSSFLTDATIIPSPWDPLESTCRHASLSIL